MAAGPLARFSFAPAGERRKRAAGAMRFAAEVFDPDTLSFVARAGGAAGEMK